MRPFQRFCRPLLLAATTVLALAQEVAAPRLLPIPQEEHGYGNFDSLVIATPGDYEAFLKTGSTARASPWNNRAAFDAALAGAKLDFAREALVLLRHTEGSGSVQVTCAMPEVKGRRLMCRIGRTEPEAGTADMAYHCFAIVVSKPDIAEIEVLVPGRPPVVLLIGAVREMPPAHAGAR